jgi:hypothetical protein
MQQLHGFDGLCNDLGMIQNHYNFQNLRLAKIFSRERKMAKIVFGRTNGDEEDLAKGILTAFKRDMN